MLGDTFGEHARVVSPLQHAHQLPIGMGCGNVNEQASQYLKIFYFQTQGTDGVLSVTIKASTDQDQLGFGPLCQLFQVVGQNDHQRLETQMAQFVKDFRENRKEVFRITEYIVDSEQLSGILR